jgi:glycine/D-amino acid oxidase-like deaminating enzyme
VQATTKRNLRTGTPVWLSRGPNASPFARLEKSLKVDVAIVGAGVSGALIADALLSTGKSVAVFDRRGPGKGSTAASTALLQFELDTPLSLLSRMVGRERAARAYWRSASAVSYLRGRIQDLGLSCGFKERSTVYLPGDVLDIKGLEREAEVRASMGLRSRFIGPQELLALTNIVGRGAILSGGSGELNPVALVAGLWRSASARGARLFAPVDVVDVSNGPRSVFLSTSEGFEVRAGHAVFATGYEPLRMVSMKGHRVMSTWAMATPPQAERLWPSRALIWEASDPYLYMRTTSDGRIVVGGCDEDFSDEKRRDALIPSKIAAIKRKLKTLLPDVETRADFAWTGSFGASSTGMPSMGVVPGARRCFAVLGYGGNGITFSTVGAQLVQRAIIGLKDPDEDLFAFTA